MSFLHDLPIADLIAHYGYLAIFVIITLGNAIKRGRLAHAFLLTGVRGVGKTSTARLIAKALNCSVLKPTSLRDNSTAER